MIFCPSLQQKADKSCKNILMNRGNREQDEMQEIIAWFLKVLRNTVLNS